MADNLKKVHIVARKISFLMAHQNILPDLKELAAELSPGVEESINRQSAEYLWGAYEALTSLITALEEKGGNTHNKA
jgi:hypothetical protein